MGSLLNDINKRGNRRTPSITKVLASLNAQDREDLIAALKDLNVPAIAIRAALAKRDITISMSAIYRYRNGEISLELE